MSEPFQPVPVPRGDGRYDIGDDMRAAIVRRLMDEWSHDPELPSEKARQLAMWAGASVRALLHEIGSLSDLAELADDDPHYIPERDGRRCVEHPKGDHELVCLTCPQLSAVEKELDRFQMFPNCHHIMRKLQRGDGTLQTLDRCGICCVQEQAQTVANERIEAVEKERDELKADSLLGRVSMSTCRSCGKEWPHPSVLSNFPTCGSCVWLLRQQLQSQAEKLEGLRERWKTRASKMTVEHNQVAYEVLLCARELREALLSEAPSGLQTEKDKT